MKQPFFAAVMTDGTFEFPTIDELIAFAKLHRQGLSSAEAAKRASDGK